MKIVVSVPPLSEQQIDELNQLYRKTEPPRVRNRAQMVLLSAEKGLKAEEIAEIVRESSVTVLRWLHRYTSEGVRGLMDASQPGRSLAVTEEFRQRLREVVRRRPRSLGLEYSISRCFGAISAEKLLIVISSCPSKQSLRLPMPSSSDTTSALKWSCPSSALYLHDFCVRTWRWPLQL
jgi:transposase